MSSYNITTKRLLPSLESLLWEAESGTGRRRNFFMRKASRPSAGPYRLKRISFRNAFVELF